MRVRAVSDRFAFSLPSPFLAPGPYTVRFSVWSVSAQDIMTVAQTHDHSPPPKERLQLRVERALRQRMSDEQFDTWFRDFALEENHGHEWEILLPNSVARDFVRRNYLNELRGAFAEILGAGIAVRVGVLPSPLRRLDAMLETTPERPLRDRLDTLDALDTSDGHAPRAAVAVADSEPYSMVPLNPRYTFEDFVVGPNNHLAHSAALAVAQNPGDAYNPYFVWGPAGFGKTHLLQSICHALAHMHRDLKVVYASCEELTNRYVRAVRAGDVDSFRNYHRSADVLIVDDVEFLANKPKVQEEFFHTFNALHEYGKQIVLSADRRGSEIPTLQGRLSSRFGWGLEIEIQPFALETRTAICKRKAECRGHTIPDDVARYVAEKVTSNARELEGAIVKVLGIAALEHRPIDMALVRDAVREGSALPRAVSLDDVLSLVGEEFSIATKDLLGKRRTASISLPRQVSMYLGRKLTSLSLEEIGRQIGGRDHTTVLYAVDRVRHRCDKDHTLRAVVDSLERRLVGGAARR